MDYVLSKSPLRFPSFISRATLVCHQTQAKPLILRTFHYGKQDIRLSYSAEANMLNSSMMSRNSILLIDLVLICIFSICVRVTCISFPYILFCYSLVFYFFYFTFFFNDSCTTIHNSQIAKIWKQSKCPMADEWIKKMWYLYTMKYHSAIKRTKSCHLQQHGWN